MNINDGSHLEKPCHFSLHSENIWRLLFCPLLGCLLACIPDQSYTAICLCSWQCCWAKPSSECKAALDAACPRTVPQQLCSLYFCQPEIQRRDTTIRSDKGILAIWRDTISFASAYIQSRFRANSLPLERQKWTVISLYCHALARSTLHLAPGCWQRSSQLHTMQQGTGFLCSFLLLWIHWPMNLRTCCLTTPESAVADVWAASCLWSALLL